MPKLSKDQQLLELASKGGNDASLLLLDLIHELEEKMAEMEKKHAEMPKMMEMMKTEMMGMMPEIPKIDLTETNKFLEKIAEKSKENIDINVRII